jgi:hypothetical protein
VQKPRKITCQKNGLISMKKNKKLSVFIQIGRRKVRLLQISSFFPRNIENRQSKYWSTIFNNTHTKALATILLSASTSRPVRWIIFIRDPTDGICRFDPTLYNKILGTSAYSKNYQDCPTGCGFDSRVKHGLFS